MLLVALTLGFSSALFADTEPDNNDYTGADALAEGDTASGSMTGSDGQDWYQIVTTQDGTIAVSLEYIGAESSYQYFQLYDNDGAIYLSSGETEYDYGSPGAAVIYVDRLAAGTYYIKVYKGIDGDYNLSYSVSTPAQDNDPEPNGTTETAIPLTLGNAVDGHINFRYNGGDIDQDDYYVVTTTEDGTLSVSLEFVSADGNYAYFWVYDSNGTSILDGVGQNYDYGSAGATFEDVNGLAAGTYYIRVYQGNVAGSYVLSANLIPDALANDDEPNNDLASANPILTNSSVTGHILFYQNGGTYDYPDYHKIELHSSGTFSQSLEISSANPGVYAYFYLYDGLGNYIPGSGQAFDYGLNGPTTISYGTLPAGTYYLLVYGGNSATSYTLTNNFCPDAITIVAEGETIICEGDYVTLSTPDHHLSYLWSTGATTSTINALLSDDYSLTIDDGNGCVRTSNTITVDVTPAPSATIIADGPTTFCEGGSVNLSVNFDADSYLWSTGETTPSITVSEGGEYQVTLTKNGCTGESQPILITVNAVPNATIVAQGPTTFCDGGSVMLKAPNGNDSYLWSTGETTSSISAVASGDYSCVVTDNDCSATSNTISVTENPIPSVSIEADGPTEFCSGESVNLNASGADSYLWSTGATTASINVTASGEYSVTGTTSGCSGVSNTISVTVTPCGSVTISADGATEFCDGGSVTLTSSEASGNVWSTGETTQSIVVTGSGDYYVTNGNNTSNTISVVVNPLPVPVIAADGATEFCDGGSVGLHTEGTYESYLWSNGETGSGITAAQNGNYSVTVTDGNGCAGSSNTIHVTVNPNPVAEIFTDDPTTFCTHMSARLIASSNGSVQWYQDGEPVGGGLNYLRVGREGSYWVVSTLGACTTTSNSIDITLLGTWVSAQPKGPKNLCEADGETVILKANPGNPSASIRWRRDGSLIAGATGQYYTATKAGNYEAIASLDGCNTPSNTVVIKNVCKDGSAMSELMSDVTLYPNPSTDYVNISMQTAQSGQVLLRLYDASGRMVQSEKFGVSAGANSYELRFAGEQAGVFMVQLILPDGSVMNRTIIRVGK